MKTILGFVSLAVGLIMIFFLIASAYGIKTTLIALGIALLIAAPIVVGIILITNSD